MNQETKLQPLTPIATVSFTTAPAPQIPRPACGRCEDWTTVVHKGNVISPCPACRPEGYDAWLAAGNQAPDA
jgi:hypothetical protein